MVNYPFREHHIYTYNLGLFKVFSPLPVFPPLGESVKNNCSFFRGLEAYPRYPLDKCGYNG